ncbi:MAG: ATP-binding protein [Acidobacteriia bacterium]|nr:ATP-binding protein [Terriglobia bacterium]
MKTQRHVFCQMEATLPGTLAAAEAFLSEYCCRRVCMPAVDWFAVELLLREALANAVKHGCRYDPAKHVRCLLRWRGRRLTIAVRDEGDGFDWRAAGNDTLDGLRTSGLGIHIFRQYATRFRFNHSGNAVTLIKRF